MVYRRVPTLLLTVISLVLWFGSTVDAAPAAQDFEFEVFYQRVESVATQSARGAANAARNAVARLKQFAHAPEGLAAPGSAETFTMNSPKTRPTWVDLFRKRNARLKTPSVGTDEITSSDNSYKYRVSRMKVTSEAQLLELMGAAGDPSKLTDGQRCLLEIFRLSQQPNVVNAMKQGFRKKVSVILTDTNGFTGDNITRDFWPCSTGDTVQFSSHWLNTPNNEQWARSVFVHEIAHSTDRTDPERDMPYGPDGIHYNNERTRPRVAFSEGWAEFNQMYYYASDAERIREEVKEIRIETSNGSYTMVPADQMSGSDLLRVEGINAVILYRMAKELPDGLNQVYRAFTATNRNDRILGDLLKQYLSDHPDQVTMLLDIIESATFGRLSDTDFRTLLGNRPALTDWLLRRAERRAAAAASASAVLGTPSGESLPLPAGDGNSRVTAPIEVQSDSGSPFGE